MDRYVVILRCTYLKTEQMRVGLAQRDIHRVTYF